MLRSSLCDYSDAYIIVKGNITINITGKRINKKGKGIVRAGYGNNKMDF